MEILVLDKNFIAVGIVDSFDSLIWADRYSKCGDFEIYTGIDPQMLGTLKPDYYLVLAGSEHVMIVEDRGLDTDSEEGNHFIFTGRSLESILDRRIVWKQTVLNGNFQDEIHRLLDENAINPTIPERIIPGLRFVASTDPVITALTINEQFNGEYILDVIEALCSSRDIGWKITLTEDNHLDFMLYSGTNRSYDQTANPYVVFSPKFDNLLDSNYAESKKGQKTISLIGGEGEGSNRKTATTEIDGGGGSGLDRREMFTDARNVSSSVKNGKNMFDKTRVVPGFIDSATGSIGTNGSYPDSKYGDLIPVKKDTTYYLSGYQAEMRYRRFNQDGSYNGGAILIPPAAWTSTLDCFIRPLFYQGITDEQLDLVQIEIGTEATSYIAFGTLTEEEYNAQLVQRGKEDLAKNVAVTSFEGRADTTILYKYGIDFSMGDILQIANEYGMETKARIVEYIHSQDLNGESTYPTFASVE